MTDRHLTIVFRDLSQEELSELAYHPKVSALSWGHVLDERDSFRWRHQRMLDQAPQPAD